MEPSIARKDITSQEGSRFENATVQKISKYFELVSAGVSFELVHPACAYGEKKYVVVLG